MSASRRAHEMRWTLLMLAACASGHEEKPAAAPEMTRTAAAEPAPATHAAGDPCEGGQVVPPQSQPTTVATADEGGAGTGGGATSGAPGMRAPRQVRFQPGTPQIEGVYDPLNVTRVIRRGLGQLRYCYEQALKKNPTLAGLLVVHF